MVVQNILGDVKQRGDEALKSYTKQFDKIELDSLIVTDEEWQTAATIPDDLKIAIQLAIKNVRTFHEAQKERFKKLKQCLVLFAGENPVAIERVGLYIPGGTAPLFSTLIMPGCAGHYCGM
jgi:histidinol dehydrogenase